MAELVTILIDIALGALAYRLALENRLEHRKLEARVTKLEKQVDELCGK